MGDNPFPKSLASLNFFLFLNGWLVAVGFLYCFFKTVFQSILGRLPERKKQKERERNVMVAESKYIQRRGARWAKAFVLFLFLYIYQQCYCHTCFSF